MDIILDSLDNEPIMFGLIEELDSEPLWTKNENNQNKRKNKRTTKTIR